LHHLYSEIMKILLAVFLITLFAVISYVFASDRIAYNHCMKATKADYISKKGIAHIEAQCRTFVLEKAFAS